MATTTNYGWTTPDDTALVKDGAAAIRTLGTSVDTTTKNLNPSTTLGDIEYRSSTTSVNTRLGIGSSGQCLSVVAGVPSWAASATSTLTTTGDLLYASAANTLARRAIGTTGQVLTVTGGLPTWATAATGAFTLLDSASFGTSASVTTASLSQSYKQLLIVINPTAFGTNNVNLRMRFNGDSGMNYLNTTNYSNSNSFNENNGVIFVNDVPSSVTDSNATILINNYTCTGPKIAQTILSATFGSNPAIGVYYSAWKGTAAISQMTFYPGSGNFASGSYEVYGVK